MDTFDEFFGFDGRLDRVGYLWRSLVMAALLAAVAGGAIWFNTYVLDPDSLTGGSGLDNEIPTGALLAGASWSCFALTTRRLRDIGLEPIYIVPLCAALWVINEVLLEPMSRLDPRDFAPLEGLWMVLQWVTAIPLLLWPSSNRQMTAPTEFARPESTAVLNWRESA